MTSRPAAPIWKECQECGTPAQCLRLESCQLYHPPESETPEVDALVNRSPSKNPDLSWTQYVKDIVDHARSLERRLSLAQTEIKGHIRVEDELKAELREADAAAQRWYLAASPYATPTALSEALAELKANNAELEKDNKLWRANWEAAHAEVQEARNFIVEQSKGNLGGGERPVEFLLASYKLMAHERAQAQARIAELEKALALALAAVSDCDGLVPEHWWLRKHAEIIKIAHAPALKARV